LCNLSFAGILTIVYPRMDTALTTPGAIGVFSGLNIVVFVLVLFLVEETRRLNLEELDLVFGRKKGKHVKYQREEQLPYVYGVMRHFILPGRFERPDPPMGYDEYVQQPEDDDQVQATDQIARQNLSPGGNQDQACNEAQGGTEGKTGLARVSETGI
jgi:hypothetical protein